MAGRKQKKACNRCGVDGLTWGKVDGRFRLFAGDVAHVCINPVVAHVEKEKYCKFCGVDGLVWGKVDGKPVLFDGDENRHACEASKCDKCRGTGEFRWGACINGRPPQFGGPCFRCNGTGTQIADDKVRNYVYDAHAIRRAFGF